MALTGVFSGTSVTGMTAVNSGARRPREKAL